MQSNQQGRMLVLMKEMRGLELKLIRTGVQGHAETRVSYRLHSLESVINR